MSKPRAMHTSIGVPLMLPDTSQTAMQLLSDPFLRRSSTMRRHCSSDTLSSSPR
uniref:Uncharacterized protein n=1 Tax=Arundo donax TaxID=35708 RepID=A0A0A8ZIL6_ARUDO